MAITDPCRWTVGFENGHFVEQQPQSIARQRFTINRIAIFPFLGI